MSYCEYNILKKYGAEFSGKEREENEKVIGLAIRYVQSELEKGTDRAVVVSNLKKLMSSFHESLIRPVVDDMQNLMKIEQRILEASRPEYVNKLGDVVDDWILGGGTGKGMSLSVSKLKEQYENKLVHGLDMLIQSRDPELLAVVKMMTHEEKVQLRNAMSGNKSSNAVIDSLADIFKNHNDNLFAARQNAGIDITFNEDYGYRRRYNGTKIQQEGFKNFALNLLNSLDFKKSSVAGATKENIAEILALSKKIDITDEEFKAALNIGEGRTSKNSLIAEVWDDYQNWVKDYDPYDEENISKLLHTKNYSEAKKARQFRSYTFKNAETEMSFMAKYGEYGDNIYEYIKADSRQAARELALVEKFGADPQRGFNDLLGQLEVKAKASGQDFNRLSAQSKFDFAAGKITRAPQTYTDVKNFKQAVSYSVNNLSNVTSTAVLGASSLSQLLDIPQTAFMYLNKSNETMLRKYGKLIYHSIAAIKDTWDNMYHNNPKYAGYIVDIMDKTIGEIDAAALRRSGAGNLADKMLTYNGAKMMNKYSSIINIRLYEDLLKNAEGEGLKQAEKFLGRYNLTKADLKFISPMLTEATSPLKLDSIDISRFINNPKGISPERYRQEMAKNMFVFVSENFKEGSPTKDMKVQYYLSGGANAVDQTTLTNSLMRMVMQFKAIPAAQLNSFRRLNKLNGQFENKILNGAYLMGSNFAWMTSGYLAVDYLKTAIRNDLDMDKTNEEYFKTDNYKQKIFNSYMRAGAFQFLTEPLVGSNATFSENPVSKFITTPSTSVTAETVSATYGMMNNMLSDEPHLIDKKQARSIYKTAKLLVPGYSLLNYVPFLDAKSQIEDEIVDMLDSIDE